MNPVQVRTATAEDAEEAVFVLRESIRKLCYADHGDDETTLEPWLRNKTIDDFGRWLSSPDSSIVVARVDGHVRGVGSVHASGQVRLCYVQPGFERLGIGRAILSDLEDRALRWGVVRLRVNSSLTARGFYERHGYARDGDPVAGFGVSKGYPYAKRLVE
jgi:GNAT superfamily N-acetyltransferase